MKCTRDIDIKKIINYTLRIPNRDIKPNTVHILQ